MSRREGEQESSYLAQTLISRSCALWARQLFKLISFLCRFFVDLFPAAPHLPTPPSITGARMPAVPLVWVICSFGLLLILPLTLAIPWYLQPLSAEVHFLLGVTISERI